jgi:CelD/BcsL family acetyltransferase involved in cellulose biosynthesis
MPTPRAQSGTMDRRSPADFDHPDSAWNRAAALTAAGDPFCCRSEWQFSFHDAFLPQRRLHLRGHGISLLAFAENHHDRLGRILEPLDAHWLFGTPILGPDGIELLDGLLDDVAADGPAPAVLVSGLLPDDGRCRPLAAALRRRGTVVRLQPQTLCHASLDGGLDGYLSRRTSGWRRNLRQAARRAADRGVRFEHHVPSTAAEGDALYGRMLAVELASWKGIGRCGMAEPPAREFYAAMLRRLAQSGAGRVVFARCDDDDIGFVFGGMVDTIYRGQQFSYHERWRGASIGNLLQLEQLRWLGETGATRYDMGPMMDYKRHWTEGRTVIEAWLLRPR